MGNMYLQLKTDPELKNIPDEGNHFLHSIGYGALAASVDQIPDAMLPGISTTLKKAFRAGIVTKGSADIAKQAILAHMKESLTGDLLKSAATAGITEGLQQTMQNLMTNAAIAQANKDASAANGYKTYQDVGVWDQVVQSENRCLGLPDWQPGLGAITGGVVAFAHQGRETGISANPNALSRQKR